MELIIFVFLCYGLSNMVVHSNGPWYIFRKWREFTEKINENLGELFSCMMCFPFYAGMLISLLNVLLIDSVEITPMNLLFSNTHIDFFTSVLVVVFDGFIGSGTTWILHNIEEYFEKDGDIQR